MNSNHVLIGNGRLPFEVLAQVFKYYLEHETAARPLETLLLVCKAWNEAACGQPSLWATYRIRLEEELTKKRWLFRLPLRLTRSGSHTPLHIDITSPPDAFIDRESWVLGTTGIDCNEIRSEDSHCALKLLEVLAGKDGFLCPRWKSLRLLLASELRIAKGEEEIILPFTYPMPALNSLHLSLRCRYSEQFPPSKKRELFPKLPSLDSIILEHFHLENYPDMSHTQKITLHRGWALEGGNHQKGLYRALNVKNLSIIFNNFLFTLPEAYLTLRTLCLAGPNVLTGLLTVSMPCLEELVIQYSEYTVLEKVAKLRDIGRILTIRVTAVPKARLAHKRRNESRGLGALLVVCKSLQTLKADEYVLSLLLEDWKHYLQPTSPLRVFFINTSGQDREIDLNDVNSTPGWNKVVELADDSEAGS